MITVFYILPWLIVLMALGFLFIDITQPKKLLLAIPILLFCIIFAVFINILTSQTQSDQNTLFSTLHERTLIEQNRNHKESLMAAKIMAFEAQNEDDFYPYSQLGLTFNVPYFKRLLHTDELLYQLLGEPMNAKTNHNIQIYRLPNDIDQLLTAEYLFNMGYQIYLPEPPEPEGVNDLDLDSEDEETTDDKAEKTTDDDAKESSGENGSMDSEKDNDLLKHKLPGVTVSLRFAKKSQIHPPLERPHLPTANHLLVGKGVSTYDIKVITLALLRAGVELRAIKKIPKLDGNNRELHVELDYSDFYKKKPVIDADRLIKKRSFK